MIADLMLPAVSIGVVIAFAWMNYGFFNTVANRMARTVVVAIEPRDMPFVDAVGIALAPSWFAVTTLVYLALAALFQLPVISLFAVTPADVLLGVALGIGEASVTMTLAAVFNRLLAPVRRWQRGGNPLLEHQILGQSGWMRTYQYPFRWLPRPVAFGLIMLPLLGEELLFRGFAIPLLSPLGMNVAVVISTALFMIVQIRHLPSWYQAVSPILGAFVMGATHGVFFALNQNLVPLLIAHLAFFVVIAIGGSPTRRT